MLTQTELTPIKKMTTSNLLELEVSAPNSNVLHNSTSSSMSQDSKDKSYEMNDRKKNQNCSKEYQYISPRRTNSNSYNNKFNRNTNRQSRNMNNNNNHVQQEFINNSKQQRLDTNNNHQLPKENDMANVHKFDQNELMMNGNMGQPRRQIQKRKDDNHYDRAISPLDEPNVNASKDNESMYMPSNGNDPANRKYSVDFLHQVGHQFKLSTLPHPNHVPKNQQAHNPVTLDESTLLALKKNLGDNSAYYNHLYSGAIYGNQIFIQPHQYQQTFVQAQQHQQSQHQQQRMRMYQRQDQRNYQKVLPHNNNNASNRMYHNNEISFDPHNFNKQQQQMQHQQQQSNQIDQRSFNNSYFQPQQNMNNLFSFQNRMKTNRDQNRKPRNQMANNGNNHRNYNKKSNDKGQNLGQTKSDNNLQRDNDLYKRKNLMYIHTNFDDFKHHRSLSSTPPSSVKSTSPVIPDQLNEQRNGESTDDSESTASASSSALSCSSDTKVFPSTPSLSFTEIEADVNENSINSWVDKSFASTQNGLSASTEQLNIQSVDCSSRVVDKRPQSTNEQLIKYNNQILYKQLDLPAYDPAYPFDYYSALCDQTEMRIAPLNLRCGSIWDKVSEQIWEKFQSHQQTRVMYQNKMNLWRELYDYIKGFPLFQQRAFPKWGLFLVGSTISGFGLDTSDIDMCLVLKAAPQLDPRTEAMITLHSLKSYLTNSGSTFQGFYLINAKVPILRFRDITNTIEVDLNYNNCIGVRNTHLLHCYGQLDWRLRPLAIIVKLWARYHNINDARNSTISSYSLVLMVIHFLQYAVSPPILPCLHQLFPDKFQVLHDITTIDMMEHLNTEWRSENNKSLGELFLRFLDYYSNFNYARDAISIRTGGILTIDECRNVRSPKNDPNHWQTLCIEEPFDLTNTARSTYDGDIFEKIKNVFFQSMRRLKETRSIEMLFKDSLFPTQQHQLSQFNSQINDMKCVVYANQFNTQAISVNSNNNTEITS